MCLLALLYRQVDGAAVIAGANREEEYARPGEPPSLQSSGSIRFLAGRDPRAGGTWLGVNQYGVLVGITNRVKSDPPAGEPRSRGLLVRELLAARSASAALKQGADELGSNRYAGCNLLCVDQDSAGIIHAGDWLRIRPLPPGIHVLTARDVNDESDRRVYHAMGWLARRRYRTADDALASLQQLCGQSDSNDPPICLHGPHGGTVSSTLVALPHRLGDGAYRHSQGPPDRTPYQDYSYLLAELR
ncbi:MAG: NRDE family protein [Gemmataceae bacterium]